MLAVSPAPTSTATSAPSAMNFLTVSGVAATRRSPSAVSLRTAIFSRVLLMARRDQPDHDRGDHQATDRAIFEQPEHRVIRLLVRFHVGIASHRKLSFATVIGRS